MRFYITTDTRSAVHPQLKAIVWFRAAAIILIVAGHSYELAGISQDTRFDCALSDLIRGATAFLVFISGFLFDYVFSARYRYWSFLLDRGRKLAIPYVVLTLLADLLFSNWATNGASSEQIFRYFVFGDAFQAYW